MGEVIQLVERMLAADVYVQVLCTCDGFTRLAVQRSKPTSALVLSFAQYKLF